MKTPAIKNAPDYTADELRPLASLISKSAKAQQKLKPGTWQHTMLRDNLKALRLASALLTKGAGKADRLAQEDGQAARRTLAAMIRKTRQARAKFAPQTSQHTLLHNRLKALLLAEAAIKTKLAKR